MIRSPEDFTPGAAAALAMATIRGIEVHQDSASEHRGRFRFRYTAPGGAEGEVTVRFKEGGALEVYLSAFDATLHQDEQADVWARATGEA